MQCVRCLQDTAEVAAKAPDGSNAWELYLCSNCNYSWRNTEVNEITDIDKRDPWFQLDQAKMAKARRVTYTASEEKPADL